MIASSEGQISEMTVHLCAFTAIAREYAISVRAALDAELASLGPVTAPEIWASAE